MLRLCEKSEQVYPQQADRSGESVDEEVGLVAQLFGKPAAGSHRKNHGGRDERNLQHIDGVAVAVAEDGTEGMAAGSQAEAEEELRRHRAAAQLPEQPRRPHRHAPIDEGGEDNADGHRPEGTLQPVADDEQAAQSNADAEGYHADRPLGKADFLNGTLQAAVPVRVEEVEHAGLEHKGLWQK